MHFTTGFILGLSFWPSVIFCLAMTCLVVTSTFENVFIGLIVIAATVAGVSYLEHANPFAHFPAYFLRNWWWIIPCIVLYFPLGIAWSMFKWNKLSDFVFEQFLEEKKTFIERWKNWLKPGEDAARVWKNHKFTPEYSEAERIKFREELEKGHIRDSLLTDWWESRTNRSSTDGHASPWKYKMRIASWICYWPWSLVAYAFSRLLKDIAIMIWKRLVNVYMAIAVSKFKDVDPRLLKRPL